MAVEFPEEGYRTLTEAGALTWCEDELENFIAHLVANVPQDEMRVGRIKEEARTFIESKQEEPAFAPITEKCDGTGGLFLGLVIMMMEEYLVALILDRFAA